MVKTCADSVIQCALNEVGYIEKETNASLDSKTANAGDGNYTKYARDLDTLTNFYNGKKNGYSWCDVFVDWCFYKTFGKEIAQKLLFQPNKSMGAGCQYSAEYYKKNNRWFTSPKIGDQIFFRTATYAYAHTGLVYDVDASYSKPIMQVWLLYARMTGVYILCVTKKAQFLILSV